jgi:hypothetical protein
VNQYRFRKRQTRCVPQNFQNVLALVSESEQEDFVKMVCGKANFAINIIAL